jgi:hypothetical protein
MRLANACPAGPLTSPNKISGIASVPCPSLENTVASPVLNQNESDIDIPLLLKTIGYFKPMQLLRQD